MNTASHIEITPDQLPWWRRLLGLGPPRAELEANLQKAVALANENATLAERLAAQRNVCWPRPERRLTREQVHKALAVPLEDPVLASILQELDDQIQDSLDLISQAPSEILTEGKRLHLAGGLEYLRLFQKQILDLHHAAQVEPTDEEEED